MIGRMIKTKISENEGIEHVETFVPRPSAAPADTGGTGEYEGVEHGMFNHNIGVAVFRDRLITTWINHAYDEDAPGGRVLARVGRVLDEEGRVAWDEPGSLIEATPAPMPVRRVKMMQDYDRDCVRGLLANGAFQVIGDRLFFCTGLWCRHGLSDDQFNRLGEKKLIPDDHFFFEQPGRPVLPVAWHFDTRFYQEWDLRGNRLEPVSPVYREGELPSELSLTPTITLPLSELTAHYAESKPLSRAPGDIRDLVQGGPRTMGVRSPRYRPGTGNVAADGHNGLSHYAEFCRPDGSWVVLRDNLRPQRQVFYYAAEKGKEEDVYPPARRTNLFGAVQPAAGEIPGLGVFVVCNSLNRRNMFLTFSRDGRRFDRTWQLLYISLQNVTPGYAKAQGGTGAGPQYMRPAVVGRSAWLVYSISKERVGATRIPFRTLETALGAGTTRADGAHPRREPEEP